jgi:iron complex outermembrane receptor protein
MKPIGTSILNLGRVVALPLAGIVLAGSVHAQDSDPLLEEITVVAQKREQNIMDVPVAITAVTGAQIEQSGIKDMNDLQQNVPGLIVGGSQTTTTSNFAIRGVGSTSNNFGVESSVGLYVDGVYRSRQSSLINELVDVQAVEVLRGPQGTLFGKNTAAGAINVRTVAPSVDERNAFVEMTVGDLDLRRISGATNIALTDEVAIRATYFQSERDGYVDNYMYDLGDMQQGIPPSVMAQENVFNDRDRWGMRLQATYDNGENFSLRLIGDYAEIDEVCCIGTSRIDSVISRGATNPGIGDFGPDFARLLMGNIQHTDQNYPAALPTTLLLAQMQAGFAPLGIDVLEMFGLPFPMDLAFPNLVGGVSWDDYITTQNYAPLSQNQDRGTSLEMNWDLSDSVTMTSVSAFRSFDTYDLIDADFTDTDIARRTNDAEQDSFSQELRFSGTFGDSSNWVAGGYYFSQKIKNITVTTAGEDLQTFTDLDNMIQGSPPVSFITQAVTALAPITGLGPGAEGFPPGAFARDDVVQDHEGYAVFGQVDWDINSIYTQTNPGVDRPNIPLIVGTLLAYNAWLADPVNNPQPDPAPLEAVAGDNNGWAAYTIPAFSPRPNVNETLSDDQVTGTAKLTWYANDRTMLYASYATGFKSGGTNTDRLEYDPEFPDNPLFAQLFRPETSKSMEIGYKGDIGDHLRLSVAAFQTDFEDFQSLTFEGNGFILRNAGDMEIKGVEIEGILHLFENTTVTGYYAYNKGEYKTFERGVCVPYRRRRSRRQRRRQLQPQWRCDSVQPGEPLPGSADPGIPNGEQQPVLPCGIRFCLGDHDGWRY